MFSSYPVFIIGAEPALSYLSEFWGPPQFNGSKFAVFHSFFGVIYALLDSFFNFIDAIACSVISIGVFGLIGYIYSRMIEKRTIQDIKDTQALVNSLDRQFNEMKSRQEALKTISESDIKQLLKRNYS